MHPNSILIYEERSRRLPNVPFFILFKMKTEIQTNIFQEEKKFDWRAYNKSQTQEKVFFIKLLRELCNLLPDKYRENCSKPMELSHIIFCLCMKSYCLKSGRRIIGELELCKRMGLISKAGHFNSIYSYLNNPKITKILQELIRFTSLPLKAIEKKFCGDSTGFGTSVLDDRWSAIRQQYSKHHKYYKAHITFGVLTNIVTSCRVTKGTMNDSPMLPELVDETAENFDLEEFSFDKAYSSKRNLEKIWEYNCLPLIPFKKGVTGKAKGSPVWREMYKFFKEHNELFMKKYHLRSNAESGMHMIKSRFGDLSNMKDETGIVNDVLSKVLCHNLCILCQEIFMLGIKFDFAQLKKESAHLDFN